MYIIKIGCKNKLIFLYAIFKYWLIFKTQTIIKEFANNKN